MRKPVALITGASAGLGAEFARQLSASGHRLVLAARRTDRLEALAAELGNARAVTADLARPGAAQALVADIERSGEQVELLVNNAGFGLHGRIAALDAARQREMIDLNCGALLSREETVEVSGRNGELRKREIQRPVLFRPVGQETSDEPSS